MRLNRIRIITLLMLVGICLAFIFAISLNVFAFQFDFQEILVKSGSIDGDGVRYLAVKLAHIILGTLELILFASFICFSLYTRTTFTKWQSFILFVIGCTALAETIIGLFYPHYLPPSEAILGSGVYATPTFDVRTLIFSLVFLALAGIFVYGRALREDSESII